MQKISTFLWFDNQAEEAANFYASVFAERNGATAGSSKVLNVLRYGEEGPGEAGTVMTVAFQLEGQGFTALKGGPEFSFTEAISLWVNCETQEVTVTDEMVEEAAGGFFRSSVSLASFVPTSAVASSSVAPDGSGFRSASRSLIADARTMKVPGWN